MAKSPAFQFYASDFLTDTNAWEVIEVGIYIRLLSTQWVNGSLPNDEERLARIAGVSIMSFKKAWVIVGFKFSLTEDGSLKNTKLEEIRIKKKSFLEKQVANGKKGGRPPKEEKPSGEPNKKPSLSKIETQSISQKKPLEDEEEKEIKGLREGGTGEYHEGEEPFYIVREFNDIWLNTMTKYLSVEARDYPSLREIIGILCKSRRLREDNPSREYLSPVLDDWAEMVVHIAGDDHFSSYNLEQVAKYIQSVGQSLAKSKKPKESVSKIEQAVDTVSFTKEFLIRQHNANGNNTTSGGNR